MSTSVFLVRLTAALCSTTASGAGSDIEFDPRLHKVIGVQTNQEKALLSLQEELVLEIGVLQVAFDAARKHSQEEKTVQQQMTLVSNFYDCGGKDQIWERIDGHIYFLT